MPREKVSNTYKKESFPKTRWIDGANPCIFTMDGDCVVRTHRKYAVAMGLPPIDGRFPGGVAGIFGEGPGRRHASKINRTKRPTSHAQDDGKRALTRAVRCVT